MIKALFIIIKKIVKKIYKLINEKILNNISAYYNKYYGVFKYFYLLRNYKKQIFIICLLSVISVSLTTSLPLITKNLIDNFYKSKSLNVLYTTMAFNISIILITWLLGMIASYTSTYLGEKLNFILCTQLQKKNSKIKFTFFQQRNAGEHIYRNTADVGGIVGIIVSIIPQTLTIVAQLTFFFCYALYLSPKLTLIYIGVLPLLMAMIIIKNIKVRPIQMSIRENSSELNDFHSHFHQGLLTTKIFQKEKFEEIRLVHILKAKFKQVLKIWRTTTLFSSSLLFINSIWGMLILYLGWSMVIKNQMTLGSLIALQMYFGRIYSPFQTGSDIYGRIVSSSVSAERLKDSFLAEEESNVENNNSFEALGNIKFSNVNFGYLPDKLVLKNLNFELVSNKIVGLTGPSGAGKSTIISLLAKLYNIDSGQILIDNKDINEINNTFLRNNISIVSQEPYLFSGTLLENIMYGNLNATEDNIYKAIKTANIETFVMELENGLQTRIGKNGVEVSVGQKKRFGLVRALVKNSPILVLDEFTASLDEVTEKDILDNIKKNYDFKNIIIVSHKVSNLLNCDTVLVLDNGTIAEQGNPFKLLEKNGLFKKLFQLQYKFFDLNLENEYNELESECNKNI